MRLVSRRSPILALILAAACAPPVHDVDGLPVERPVLRGSAPGARLVVDSTPRGWRALAELHRSDVVQASLPTYEPVPELRCDQGHTFRMLRIRTDRPRCRALVVGEPDAPRGDAPPSRDLRKCVWQQVVEYRLLRPPAEEEVWTLATGESVRRVRWEVP